MPPYKILLDFNIQAEDRFKRFLNSRETARGVPCNILLNLTNIGSEIFPGGKVSKLEVHQVGFSGMVKQFQLGDESIIGRLDPEENWKPINIAYIQEWEGVSRMTVQCVASDSQPVQLFQHRAFPMSGEWVNFFYSINRENLIIIEALERLIGEMASLKKDTS